MLKITVATSMLALPSNDSAQRLLSLYTILYEQACAGCLATLIVLQKHCYSNASVWAMPPPKKCAGCPPPHMCFGSLVASCMNMGSNHDLQASICLWSVVHVLISYHDARQALLKLYSMDICLQTDRVCFQLLI